MKANVILLLTLLATVVRAGQDCPNKSLFEPCHCALTPFISVTCNDIWSVDQLQRVLDNTLDYPIDEWSIVDSSLPYLNSTWLAEKKTMKLRLHNTVLVDMFVWTYTSTLPSVEYFAMERSVILRGMRWINFKPFVRLQSLSVLSAEIKRLGKDFRENVTPELKYLYMEDTKTSVLEEGDFEGKRKLETIQIAKSGLKVLKNSFFKDQKASLLEMNFSHNPIESLPDDLFQGFQNLGHVYLKYCNVKTLSESLFQQGPRGLYFDINDNPMVCDCKMKWILDRSYGSYYLIGTCKSPPDLKGRYFTTLVAKDFYLCK